VPAVRFAVRARRLVAAARPDDPRFGEQWHLSNSQGAAGADIGALGAWELSRGAGVTVAVIDAGVDVTHPELAGQLAFNAGERVDGRDNDGNGYVDDTAGWNFLTHSPEPAAERHGTAVASLALAVAGNDSGGVGVAPAARLLALRVLNDMDRGAWDWPVAEAMAYAGRMGVRVVNLSLGGSGSAQSASCQALPGDAVRGRRRQQRRRPRRRAAVPGRVPAAQRAGGRRLRRGRRARRLLELLQSAALKPCLGGHSTSSPGRNSESRLRGVARATGSYDVARPRRVDLF
jgi:hypothetical protein